MTLKYLILGGSALLVGFLFYPRGDETLVVDRQFAEPVRVLDNEPLHYTDILRTDPIVTTYDLGFVYRIDKAEVLFEDADESGPRQYDILVHTDLTRQQFVRAFSYSGSSREYTYTVQAFSLPVDARWVQVVINDWFSNKPQLKKDAFRVGVLYQSHGPIRSIHTNYNSAEVSKLIDLVPFGHSKWIAAQRIEKETTGEDGKQKTEISYKAPTGAIEVTGDLGTAQKIYGVRLTVDSPGLKRYHALVSTNGQSYTEVYVSDALTNGDAVTDLHLFHPPLSGRYIRLRLEPEDWYGDSPEIREFEIFTDNYRLPPPAEESLRDHNAVQMHYENLGEAGNSFTPHLVEGFAFDRGTNGENRYLLLEGDAPDKVGAGNTPSQRSFAYHYDTVKIRYTGLEPAFLYWIRVTYLQERDGERIQNLDIDGFLLHGAMVLPKGKSESYTYAIPIEAYADGEIAVNFNRLAGPNAAVSEVFIMEANPAVAASPVSTVLREPNNQTRGRAIRVTEEVVIDGVVNEWPLLYPMLPPNYDTPVNSPAVLYTQWDHDNLYIAAIINRQARARQGLTLRRENQKHLGLGGNEALHLFIDTALRTSPGMYTRSDHHLVFTILKPQSSQPHIHPSQIHHHLDAIPKNIDFHNNIETQVTRTRLGYNLEAKIPKDLVLNKFQPAVGRSIGLNYIMANLRLVNKKSVGFAYTSDDLNAPPNRWNEVELLNQISGRAVLRDARATQPITAFNAGDTLTLCVWDADRNTDRYAAESMEAELRNDTTGQSMTVVLHESDLATLADGNPDNDVTMNSSLFAAKRPTAYGRNGEMTDMILRVHGADRVSLRYIDPYYSSTQREYPVNTTVTVNTGATGAIAVMTESGEPIKQFQLGETIYIQVADADLPEESTESVDQPVDELTTGGPKVTINLVVPETEEIEPLELIYLPKQGWYRGLITTAYREAPAPGDGVLQAVGTQIVVAIYVDQIQATGETSVPVNAQASVEIGDTAKIEFSETTDLLIANAQKFFKAGNPLTVRLRDTDLNHDDSRQETVDVSLVGDQLKDQHQLTLKETTTASGAFTGTCATQYATGANIANDVLEVTGEEIVTVHHIDRIQGSGKTWASITDSVRVRSGKDSALEIISVGAGSQSTPTIIDAATDLESFNAGDRLYFRLRDKDIVHESVEITLIGETLNDQETVQLFQSIRSEPRVSPIAGMFFNSIETAYSTQPQEGDGILQVQGSEDIQAIYIDELRSTGETDIAVYDGCVANVGTTGSLKVYNKGALAQTSERRAKDNGVLLNEISRFRTGDTLILEIRDADLSTTSAVAQLFETDFTENTVRDDIRVTMVEVTGSAGIFRGEIETSYGETPIPNDNVLQVQGAGIVTFTYIDALQDTGETQVPIRVQLSVETGDKGELEIYNSESCKVISGFSVGTGSFNAGEKLRIRLQDKDLNAYPTATDVVEVMASGNVIADEVRLILRETSPNSAIFEADLQTQKQASTDEQIGERDKGKLQRQQIGESPLSTDQILQVTDKEVITVVYVDEITTTGETGVPIQIQAVVLGSSAGVLRIVDGSNVEAKLVSAHELGSFNAGETIYFWLEDLLLSTVVAATEVEIAVTGDKTQDKVEVTLFKHPGTEGIFVGSVPTRYGTAPVADETLDVQGDEEIRAIYTPNFPAVNNPVVEDHAYVNKGVLGYIVITRKDGTVIRNCNVGTTLHFRLEDADLNLDPFVVESTDLQVTTGTQETVVTLHEENPNSHIFRGKSQTQYGRTITEKSARGKQEVSDGSGSDVLGLIGGELVMVIYKDTLTDTGATNVEISSTCRANLIAWAPYTSNPVLIDGHEDGWPLEKVLETPQYEGLLWLQWDKDYLYLLAQIYDAEVVVPDVIEYYRGGDALELHLDLQPDAVKTPSYLQTEDNPNRYVLWFCPEGGGFHGNRPYVGQGAPEFIPNYQAANLDIAVRQRSNHYVIEIRIPFASVLRGFDPLKTTRHHQLGFNFVIHRSDDQAVYWAAQMPETGHVFPSDLGLLILESPLP